MQNIQGNQKVSTPVPPQVDGDEGETQPLQGATAHPTPEQPQSVEAPAPQDLPQDLQAGQVVQALMGDPAEQAPAATTSTTDTSTTATTTAPATTRPGSRRPLDLQTRGFSVPPLSEALRQAVDTTTAPAALTPSSDAQLTSRGELPSSQAVMLERRPTEPAPQSFFTHLYSALSAGFSAATGRTPPSPPQRVETQRLLEEPALPVIPAVTRQQMEAAAEGTGFTVVEMSDGSAQLTFNPEQELALPDLPEMTRTDAIKGWIEQNILGLDANGEFNPVSNNAISRVVQGIQLMLQRLYPTLNPLLILQAKLGSGYHPGSSSLHANAHAPLGGWAQSGIQMNIVSRGLNFDLFGNMRPIIQFFPLHTEAGANILNTSWMSIQNLGFNFVPDANNQYHLTNPELMFEQVFRAEAGATTVNTGAFAMNNGLGADTVHHRYWRGNTRSFAAAVIGAAQAAGYGLGYTVGSSFQTGVDMLRTASDILATINNSTNSSNSSNSSINSLVTEMLNSDNNSNNETIIYMRTNSTGHVIEATRLDTESMPAVFTDEVPNYGHIAGALGSQMAGQLAASWLDASAAHQPSGQLHMRERTVQLADMFINIPLGQGTTLTFAALPRVHSTTLISRQGECPNVYANQPALYAPNQHWEAPVREESVEGEPIQTPSRNEASTRPRLRFGGRNEDTSSPPDEDPNEGTSSS